MFRLFHNEGRVVPLVAQIPFAGVEGGGYVPGFFSGSVLMGGVVGKLGSSGGCKPALPQGTCALLSASDMEDDGR